MEAFLSNLIKKIVQKPELVSTILAEDQYNITITISADQADAGRIIGKKGRTINALRSLLYVFASRHSVNEPFSKRIILHLAS